MPTHCPSWLTRVVALLRDCALQAPLVLVLLAMLLAGSPARAANYLFPGKMPTGCTDSGSGNYSCGILTLADGDAITIASPKPATITFSGAFTTGNGTQINAGGASTDLTINAAGAVTINTNVNFNGNIVSSAAVTAGDNSTIGGYILTSSPTGVVTIGDNNRIGGYIKTEGGAVTIGGATIVNGSIGTVAGVVAIGAASTIKGSVSTDAGAITTGTNVTISGSIGTQIDTTRAGIGSQAGVITIGPYNNINGTLSTNAGAITVGPDSIIGGAATPVGVITFGARVSSSGDVISGAGAINIGDQDIICGKVLVFGDGIVTLTTNVKLDGGISTTAGAITVGSGSNIGGDVTVTGAGVVTLTGVLIAGNVNTVAGAITITGSKVRGSVAASGAGVVTLTGTTQNDSSFTISAACVAPTIPVVPTPTTAAATFDALEYGNLWNPIPAAHNALYTKVAGNPFSLDIAALKADRTLEGAYVAVGAIARHVTLELFDDTGAACSAYTTPVATQTASFRSALLSTVPGRALSGAFVVDNVHRSLLVRIKECTDSACTVFTGTAPTCSSDRFSVRPPALTLSTTSAMPSSQAPTATASQTIQAGADFTLRAQTSPTGGYDGVLTLDSSKLTAQLPSQDTSTQSGGAVGVLTPSALTANAAQAIMANYSEAGYLYISPGAYRDDSFTAIDSRFGDCITSTANNAYLADTLIDGKYGCSIGNKLTVRMGRFIPDHFSTEIMSGAAMPCPAGLICPPGLNSGVIYSRQPFAITVTARSLGGARTLNYRDKLARNVTLTAWSAAGGIVPAGPADSVLGYSPGPVAAATFALGVADASPNYAFATSYPATALAAPTDIYLRADETGADSDAVTSLRTVAQSSIEGGIKVISGRLHVANNYGSELLAVPVVVRAQYWNGTRFVNSSTDQKTSFTSLDVKRSNCKRSLTSGGNCMAMSITAPASPLMVNGVIRLTLAAPGAGNTGSVDLNINSFDWLPSTTARIGVGIYKSSPVIYMREMY